MQWCHIGSLQLPPPGFNKAGMSGGMGWRSGPASWSAQSTHM
ncbi:hypothetical protein AAY473_027620 [Plecturocebus cupreus]